MTWGFPSTGEAAAPPAGTGGIYGGSGSLGGTTTVTLGANDLLFDGDGNLGVSTAVLEGGAAFAATTTTATLGFRSTYGCTSTAAPRTLTISSADIAKGSVARPWRFIVKDESGAAGTNSITVDTEGSETIDGDASQAITVDYGVLRLYSNGTNLFSW